MFVFRQTLQVIKKKINNPTQNTSELIEKSVSGEIRSQNQEKT